MNDNIGVGRRRFLALLAAGLPLAASGRARATGDDPPVAIADPYPGTVGLFGTYRGATSVEFLYEGERRSTQSGVVVRIDEPLQHEDGTETNPFSLAISTTPSISEAGGAYEGMYDVRSAGVYFQGASAPGLDYRPVDTWMEQHWELTVTDGQLVGALLSTNSAMGNALWYAYPGSSTDIGYGPPVVFEPGIAPSGFRVGATMEGGVDGSRFTASITGSTPQIDAFAITIAAERPTL